MEMEVPLVMVVVVVVHRAVLDFMEMVEVVIMTRHLVYHF